MTKPTRREENKLYRRGYKLIAGTDEAGRGAWAGPLVAAAVILPKQHSLRNINDSKKLSSRQRERLYVAITKKAIAWATTIIESEKIDMIGITRANYKALRGCVSALPIKPEAVLVDAFNISYRSIPHRSIIKGDARVISIAAASIIAKVTRDSLMIRYHRRYPRYLFHRHKGYGTREHHRRIVKYGLSPLHRRSFEPMRSMGRKH